jgi:FkbM family methyltransferase
MIFDAFFRGALRLPQFRGRWRILSALRRCLYEDSPVGLKYGFKMHLDPLEWTQLELIERGTLEPVTTDLFLKLLQPGDTYIDVGAHVGFYTLIARTRVGASGRVVAVEPQPYNADRILQNWAENSYTNLTLFLAAAGDVVGDVKLQLQPVTDRARLSLGDSVLADKVSTFTVPVRRIEDVFASEMLRNIKLLKIDVEGFELQVLRGVQSRLSDVQNLVFEFLPAANESKSGLEVLELIRGQGFRLFDVLGQPWDFGQPLVENNVWARRVDP